MVPFIVRHLILPLHERLVGRPTFACLRRLERSQWASPDEIRAMQRRKLRSLLLHADAHIPFYRELLRHAGIDAANTDPFTALDQLPLIDKDRMRARRDDMVWHQVPGGLHERNTGGSTGEPLIFYFDRRRQAYDQAARARSHRWFGVKPGDREIYLWGSPIELSRGDGIKRLRDRLVNHRLLDAFDMSPARMDRYLDVLERYRPACLFGYPSSIALLIEHAEDLRRPCRSRSLRAVFVTGEVCYPHHRKAIADFFAVPVADGYGSREAGFIAHECPAGAMHITAENVIVEIVDEGRSMPPGESGEIVVTHLDAYAMPFIRYRTGDRGRLKPGRCACGRGLPLMDVVHGRATDFLYLPDGTVKHALSVIYPLRAMPGIRQFHVTQHEDFTVTVNVVCNDRVERVTKEAVAKSVKPVFGNQVEVRVDLVNRIAPTASGKYRYVVSHARPVGVRAAGEVREH